MVPLAFCSLISHLLLGLPSFVAVYYLGRYPLSTLCFVTVFGVRVRFVCGGGVVASGQSEDPT
jgi:hypothetical protein